MHFKRNLRFTRMPSLIFAFALMTNVIAPSGYSSNGPQWMDDASMVDPLSVQQISLPTGDIIYDKFSHTIYASVPSSAGSNGNSITKIDPSTCTIGTSVFIGSEPSKLALSTNSQYLYAVLGGAASVRRFDIASQSAGLQFSLGTDPQYGPLGAEDIEALPHTPDSIAVSLVRSGTSPRHGGVAIFDNGVKRLTVTPGNTGSNVIEFSNSASVLYGYNNETSEFGFRKMAADSNGVSVVTTTPGLMSEYNLDIKYDTGNGLTYSTSGRVIDPAAGTIIGTFPLSSPYNNLVEPDSRAGRVYFLTTSGGPTYTLRAFNQQTFLPVGTPEVITGVAGTPTSLIRWGANGFAFRTTGGQVFLIRSSLVPALDPIGDFDGDGKTDVAVFRPSDSTWYVTNSSNSAFSLKQFGVSSDVVVPGDYDGDTKTDIAVFRPDSGTWYIIDSSSQTFRSEAFGTSGDIPVAADYDGDNKTDLAVFRPGVGFWYILESSSSTMRAQQFGVGSDYPVRGDFDGDGKSDLTVFRPSEGTWYTLTSADSTVRSQQFGIATDRLVAGDYDGDGKSDVAVYRSSEGTWYVRLSSNGTLEARQFGVSIDMPAPGDYDGDGMTDFAVFRPNQGTWYVLQSSAGFKAQQFGVNSDLPIPSSYVP